MFKLIEGYARNLEVATLEQRVAALEERGANDRAIFSQEDTMRRSLGGRVESLETKKRTRAGSTSSFWKTGRPT